MHIRADPKYFEFHILANLGGGNIIAVLDVITSIWLSITRKKIPKNLNNGLNIIQLNEYMLLDANQRRSRQKKRSAQSNLL